jgi:hypothetical protein
VAERKRQLRSFSILLGIALVSYILYHVFRLFSGASPVELLDVATKAATIEHSVVEASKSAIVHDAASASQVEVEISIT